MKADLLLWADAREQSEAEFVTARRETLPALLPPSRFSIT